MRIARCEYAPVARRRMSHLRHSHRDDEQQREPERQGDEQVPATDLGLQQERGDREHARTRGSWHP